MTDRRWLPWQFAFACATLGVIGGFGVLLRLHLAGTAKPLAVIIPLPAIWLAVAAFFGRNNGRAVRGWTAAVCTYAAVVNIWLALLLVPWLRGRLPAILSGHPAEHELFILAEFPLALIILVANSISWWRRWTRDHDLRDED